jgi:membrane-associated phospholipid phosphatase
MFMAIKMAMKRFLKSIRKSISGALSKNEYIVRWRKKHPIIFGFIKRKSSLINPYGFYFNIGAILSVIAFFYFIVLAQDILARDPFIEADVRFMNLIAALRSIATANFFLLFTLLGNWQFIISLGVVIIVVLILLKEKRKSFFLAIGVIGGGIVYSILKLIIHRTRPDIGFSLIPRSGYAFPSGHATISLIFYGTICCGLLRTLKIRWLKILSIILTIILIFLIGFSRIYLGVHWVSDVLAGWALGMAFLILLITFFIQQEKFKPEKRTENIIPKRFVLLILIFLFVLESGFFYYFYKKYSLIEPERNQSQVTNILPQSDFQAFILSDNFPKFSETIIGEKMEPISFIMIGSREQIIQIFKKLGWFMTDEPHHFKNLYHMTVAAIFNQSYPTAPVTPSFLNAQPNAIAFEKPTEINTIKQRHHTRFWLTNFQWSGVPIWVATASFDDGLRYFITHKIHPDVDTERDFIKNELISTGLVKNEEQIQLIKPLMGKNQSGDKFFTDGKAYIISLIN